MNTIIQTIISTFEQRGSEKYADEGVTQRQHALQCAELARAEQVPDTLVVAALLHDIGHILGSNDLPTDCGVNLDDEHESVGFDFLKSHFGMAVAQPVKLHVSAKRYLCTTQPGYLELLSPTSRKSFFDQGGMMSEAELAEFRADPHHSAAIQLRRWDDLAKDADKNDGKVADFLPELHRLLA